MKIVMDTNIYCDFAEGVPQTIDVLSTSYQFISCLPETITLNM